MGLSAIVIVGQNPAYFEGGNIAGKMIGGTNMPALHLAHAVGGNLLLGFLAAVAFATILAVVSGLALAGASAIAHDIYANAIKLGKVSESVGSARLQDLLAGSGRDRGAAGHSVREVQCRLPGGSRLRHRGLVQLPGAVPFHVLEGSDHPGRGMGRSRGAGCRGGDRGVLEGGVGHGARSSDAALPVRTARHLLDAVGVLRLLAGIQARHQRAGRQGKGCVRGSVRARADRVRCCRARQPTSRRLTTTTKPRAAPPRWACARVDERFSSRVAGPILSEFTPAIRRRFFFLFP